jgi:chemotaxis protein CheX
MQIAREELQRLVESVWAAVLDLEARPAGPGGGDDFLTGWVPVSGAWEGCVLLACAPALACAAAARMFGVPAAEVTPDQVRDALGELTNMIGGNVKALLPGANALGLPAVADAGESLPDGPCLARLAFACGGLPFQVAVVAGTAVAPAARP